MKVAMVMVALALMVVLITKEVREINPRVDTLEGEGRADNGPRVPGE
jgi:hypothetical protein